MDREPPMIEHDSNEGRPASIWYAVALIVFGIALGGWHWLITGINEDFGTGVVVGAILFGGLIFLLSRKARELP